MENHVAQRLLEKLGKAEADKLKGANADQIKVLEVQIKQVFNAGNLPEIEKLSGEIKKLDPTNKVVSKIEAGIEKARNILEKQERKEKVKALTAEIEVLMKVEKWDEAEVKANELLKVEKDNSFALKALKKVDKTKPKSADNAVETRHASSQKPKKEKKPGFFTRLFGKKKAPEKKEPSSAKPSTAKATEAPATEAPEVKSTPMPIAEAPKPVAPKAEPPKPAVKPTAFTPPPKPIVSVPVVLKKPAEGTEPVEGVEPVEPIKSAEKAPSAAVPLSVAAKPAVPATPKSAAKTEAGKGNIFTKLFGKNEAAKGETAEKPSKSIIDTIVAKTEEGKKTEKKEKKEDIMGEGLLRFATVFLEFSVAFILISVGFFYVQNIDEENRVLSLLGIEENNASQLYSASQELEQKEKEEKGLAKEIKKYKEEQEDENKKTIQEIIDGRLDWPDLIKKLNEVTESIYEKNPLSQYVQYNNYSYDVEQGQLRVNATLSDPLGKNLTKLAEIEEAFRYYPKDKNDPTDEREPYFYGLQDFRSFSKSFDKATGRYKSSFSLVLFTKPPEDK